MSERGSEEQVKKDLGKLSAKDLETIAESRGVEGASDLKKDQLVETLSSPEHASSVEVAEKTEDKIGVEYVGAGGAAPPQIVPFLSDEQLGRPLASGDKFNMPASYAEPVLLNGNFRASDKAGEDFAASLKERSKRASLEARAAIAAGVDGLSGDAETDEKIKRLEASPRASATATPAAPPPAGAPASSEPEGGNA